MVENLTSPNKESRIFVEVKSMKLNGFNLVEWKKKKLVNSEGTIKISNLIHSRSIDDRTYTVVIK